MIKLIHGDCAEIPLDDNSVDLIVGSPPYENMRSYGIGFNLSGQEWVDWCVPRYMECLRVSRGLVAWVVGFGMTRRYKWSATPALLIADLHRQGVCLRNPPLYRRVGIPGSGGPDWWRADYEWIVAATKKRGRLPWSNNTATGQPPKYAPGGRMTNRAQDGTRQYHDYTPPKLANPGNIISGKVGGGHMGSTAAHKGEAPYPEWLVEPLVRSFCPPGGIVLDPFCGTGTTLAVAAKWCRYGIGMDIRESQLEITRERLFGVQMEFAGLLDGKSEGADETS